MNTKTIARIAGLGYLIIFFTGFFSNFYVLDSLVVEQNSISTTNHIFQNIELFNWGVISFIIMIVVDVLLAAPLYHLLKPVNQELALFSSAIRMVNGTIFAVALYSLLEVKQHYLISFGKAELVHQQVYFALEMFQSVWNIALIFFAVHLLLLGYLMIQSSQLPAFIGILLIVASLGYFIDCFAQIGFDRYQMYQPIFENIVVIPAVIGEFSLTLFLLTKGVNTTKTVPSQFSTLQTR